MVEKRGELASGISNKLILKKAVEHRIKQTLAKAFISEKEVYTLIRGFFKKYINIDYEFTSDELIKELRKIYLTTALQERIRSLLDRLSEMEHLTRAFTRSELESMLTEFNKIVDEMIVSHYESDSFVKRMLHFFEKSFSGKHKTVLDEGTTLAEEEQLIVRMNILLDDSKRWASKDLSVAKRYYKELISIYNTLDEDRKKAFYKPVNELFSIIKAKER